MVTSSTDNVAQVTIDAGVVAIPQSDCTKSGAYRYVDKILNWGRLLDEPWIAVYMSERSSYALVEDQLYPFRDRIRELFDRHEMVEFSVNDIATVVDRLLTRTPTFETYFRVKDVLSDNLQTDPDLIRLTAYTGLQNDLERCITLIAVLRKYCLQPIGGHSLLLIEAPTQIVHVRAQIQLIEHTRDDIPTLPSPPQFFEGDVLVCDDFNGLIECLDETGILVNSSNDFGLVLAIKVALYKYFSLEGNLLDWDSIVVPSLGHDFRTSCQRICADRGDTTAAKILRAVIETVEGINHQKVHAIRTGRAGNNPQITRGFDRGQRRDIDSEIHLHYWVCADGAIELASVVYHNDFSIS